MSAPLPYCNNLQKGDTVEVAKTKRRGTVHSQPRETSVNVHVLLDGIETPRYFHINEIRFVVDGVAEDVAPCDGEPPTPEAKFTSAPPPATSAPGAAPLNQLLRTRRDLTEKLANVDEHIFRLLAEQRA